MMVVVGLRFALMEKQATERFMIVISLIILRIGQITSDMIMFGHTQLTIGDMRKVRIHFIRA